MLRPLPRFDLGSLEVLGLVVTLAARGGDWKTHEVGVPEEVPERLSAGSTVVEKALLGEAKLVGVGNLRDLEGKK